MSSDKIKLLKEQGKTIYPQTLSDAVLMDDESDKTLLEHIEDNFVTKEEFDDNSVVMGKVNDALSEFKDDVVTALDNVADKEHNHDNEYASKDHIHEEYLTKLPSHFHKYNNIVFPKDLDNESLKTEIEKRVTIDYFNNKNIATNEKINKNTSLLNDRIDTHNHDGKYSQLDHKHDTLYSSISHNHDNLYMPINKNFDDRYAKSSHSHDYNSLVNTPHIPTVEDMKREINLDRYDNLIDDANTSINELSNLINNNKVEIDNIEADLNTKANLSHTHNIEDILLDEEGYNLQDLLNSKDEINYEEHKNIQNEIIAVDKKLMEKINNHTHNLNDIDDILETTLSNGDRLIGSRQVDEKIINALKDINYENISGLEEYLETVTVDIEETKKEIFNKHDEVKNELESYTSSIINDINNITEVLPKKEDGSLEFAAPIDHYHDYKELPEDIVNIEKLDGYVKPYVSSELDIFFNDRVKLLVDKTASNYSKIDHVHEGIENNINLLSNAIESQRSNFVTYRDGISKILDSLTTELTKRPTDDEVGDLLEGIKENYSEITHNHNDLYANVQHNHDDKYMMKNDTYLSNEIDEKLIELKNEINITNYLNQDQVNNLLNTKANSDHTHTQFNDLSDSVKLLDEKMKEFTTQKDLEEAVSNQLKLSLDVKVDKEYLETNYITEKVSDLKYAEKSHTHEYADKEHTHDNYATKDHIHENTYYTQEYINSNFSLLTHNHDDKYSNKEHRHDSIYSEINHDHDDKYISIDTDFDAKYAALVHNHDEYALRSETASLDHEHDLRYAKREELDDKANLDHNHDEFYAGVDHKHTEYISSDLIDTFAKEGHTHEELYADKEHTHDLYITKEDLLGTYATKDELDLKASVIHTHENYITSTEATNNFSEKGHVHNEYASISHTHEGLYADREHTHDNYSTLVHNHDGIYVKVQDYDKDHSHDQYALKEEVAESEHTHDDLYAIIEHGHDDVYAPLEHEHEYAPLEHKHEGEYALVEHEHETYALKEEAATVTHDHDGRYSLNSHNHNKVYSPIDHNHEKLYATIDHEHGNYLDASVLSNNYYDKETVDDKLSNHKHDNVYTKSETLSTAETELKILNASLGITKDSIQSVIDETAKKYCNCDCEYCKQEVTEDGKIEGVTISGTLMQLYTQSGAELEFNDLLFERCFIDEKDGKLKIYCDLENHMDENYFLAGYGKEGGLSPQGIILESKATGLRIYFGKNDSGEIVGIDTIKTDIEGIELINDEWQELTTTPPKDKLDLVEIKGYKYQVVIGPDDFDDGNINIDGVIIGTQYYEEIEVKENPDKTKTKTIMLKSEYFILQENGFLSFPDYHVDAVKEPIISTRYDEEGNSYEEVTGERVVQEEINGATLNITLDYVIDKYLYRANGNGGSTIIPGSCYSESEGIYTVSREYLDYSKETGVTLLYINRNGLLIDEFIPNESYKIIAAEEKEIGLSIDSSLFVKDGSVIKFYKTDADLLDIGLVLGDNYKEIKLTKVEMDLTRRVSKGLTKEEINVIDEGNVNTKIRISDAIFANLYNVLENKITVYLSQEYDELTEKLKNLEKAGMLKQEYDLELAEIKESIEMMKREITGFLEGVITDEEFVEEFSLPMSEEETQSEDEEQIEDDEETHITFVEHIENYLKEKLETLKEEIDTRVKNMIVEDADIKEGIKESVADIIEEMSGNTGRLKTIIEFVGSSISNTEDNDGNFIVTEIDNRIKAFEETIKTNDLTTISSDYKNCIDKVEKLTSTVDEYKKTAESYNKQAEAYNTSLKEHIEFVGSILGEKIVIPYLIKNEEEETPKISFIFEKEETEGEENTEIEGGNYVNIKALNEDGEYVEITSDEAFYSYIETIEVHSAFVEMKDSEYFNKLLNIGNPETDRVLLFSDSKLIEEIGGLDKIEKVGPINGKQCRIPAPGILVDLNTYFNRLEELKTEIEKLKTSNHLDVLLLNNLLESACSNFTNATEELNPVAETTEGETETPVKQELVITPLINLIKENIQEDIDEIIIKSNDISVELGKIKDAYTETNKYIEDTKAEIDKQFKANSDLINQHDTDINIISENMNYRLESCRQELNSIIDSHKIAMDEKLDKLDIQLDNYSESFKSNIIEPHQVYLSDRLEEIREIVNEYEEKCKEETDLFIEQVNLQSDSLELLYSDILTNIEDLKDNYMLQLEGKLEDLSNDIFDVTQDLFDTAETARDSIEQTVENCKDQLDWVAGLSIGIIEDKVSDATSIVDSKIEGITNNIEARITEFEEAYNTNIEEANVLLQNKVDFANTELNQLIANHNIFISNQIDDFTDSYESHISEANNSLNDIIEAYDYEIKNYLDNFTTEFDKYIIGEKQEISNSHDNLINSFNELTDRNTETIRNIANSTNEACNSVMIEYDRQMSSKIETLNSVMDDFEFRQAEIDSKMEYVLQENIEKYNTYDLEIKNVQNQINDSFIQHNEDVNTTMNNFSNTLNQVIADNNNLLNYQISDFTESMKNTIEDFKGNHIVDVEYAVSSNLDVQNSQIENIINEFEDRMQSRVDEMSEFEESLDIRITDVEENITAFNNRIDEYEESINSTVNFIEDKVNNIENEAIEKVINDNFMTKDQIMDWMDENPSAHSHSSLNIYVGHDGTGYNNPAYYYYQLDVEGKEIPESDRDYWDRSKLEIAEYNPTRQRLTIDKIYATKPDVKKQIENSKKDIESNVFNSLKDTVIDSIEDTIKQEMEDGVQLDILKAYNRHVIGIPIPDFVTSTEDLLIVETAVKSYDEMIKHMKDNEANHSHSKYVTEQSFRTHNHDDLYYTKAQVEGCIGIKTEELMEESFGKRINEIKSDVTIDVTNTMRENYVLKSDFDSHINSFEELVNNVSLKDHEHDNYATKLELSEKANFTHNHNGIYSPVDHKHDYYQPKGDYVTREEVENNIVMDGVYARVDDTYSKEIVYTKAEVNGLLTKYHADFVKKDEIYNIAEIDSKIEEINTQISEVNKLPEDVYTKQEVLDLLHSSIEHMHEDYMKRITALEEKIAELEGKLSE